MKIFLNKMQNGDYNVISPKKEGLSISAIIAVTSSLTENAGLLVSRAYIDAIIRAGGVPLILPPIKKADALRVPDFADGVLLTGGGDISPRLYGAEAYDTALLCDPCPLRDESELALTRLCFERDIPTLAICRGVQVMTVALGGTLHFHIDCHTKTHAREDPHHSVSVAKGSQLCRLVGEDLYVNTCHHQAVSAIGNGLCVSARSEDGVIEATEAPGKRFFIGVQWHPERMQAHASDVLFAAFVAACDGTHRI